MHNYIGRHAQLYDLFYGAKPYQAEGEFVHAILQAHQTAPVRRILELACGTGEHAFALEQMGYQVVAFDSSPDMLERARQKATQHGSRVDFRHDDMRTFRFADAPFDAAISLFDSIGYVITDSAILDTMTRVRDHLTPNGLFVFEFWHAPAMLNHFDPVRVRRWPTASGDILRISETSLDRARRTGTVHYTVFEPCEHGQFSKLEEAQTNRFFDIPEIESLLGRSGFVALKHHAGYSFESEINDQAFHIVTVARRHP